MPNQKNLKSTHPSSSTPTKGSPLDTFHGLVVHYKDGSYLMGRTNYISDRTNKLMATSWSETPKEGIVALEIRHKGNSVIKLELSKIPNQKIDEWYFCHTGAVDTAGKSILISRNIGFILNGTISMYRVVEETGAVAFESKRVPNA